MYCLTKPAAYQWLGQIMQLEIGGKGVINQPGDIDIVEAIASLQGGDDSFAVLAATDQYYVQCSGSVQVGFDLEYRDGSESRHFRAAVLLDVERVVQAMQRYNRGEVDWNEGIEFISLSGEGAAAGEVPREKPEKFIEYSYGTVVISRVWLLNILGLLMFFGPILYMCITGQPLGKNGLQIVGFGAIIFFFPKQRR